MMHKAIMATLLFAAAAAGCTNPQVKPDAAATGGATSTQTTQTGAAAKDAPSQDVSATTTDPFADANNLLSKRSIYYDFDNSTIKGDYKSEVQAHGAYLASHGGAKVVIEGNCDERGSREYNVGLGQRRADSVKSMLKLLGVKDGQIQTVSWGKEKPKAMGHSEAAWAENRRSDIVYKSKD